MSCYGSVCFAFVLLGQGFLGWPLCFVVGVDLLYFSAIFLNDSNYLKKEKKKKE